jgi:hypothetical protein
MVYCATLPPKTTAHIRLWSLSLSLLLQWPVSPPCLAEFSGSNYRDKLHGEIGLVLRPAPPQATLEILTMPGCDFNLLSQSAVQQFSSAQAPTHPSVLEAGFCCLMCFTGGVLRTLLAVASSFDYPHLNCSLLLLRPLVNIMVWHRF